MKSDVIRKRSRHDARRAAGPIEQTPSTSPGASRRPSPVADNVSTPTFAPDSTTQSGLFDIPDYSQTTASELLGALGDTSSYTPSYSLASFAQAFPGPYHPEYLAKNGVTPADALPYSNAENLDNDDSQEDHRASKRRRMSNVSSVSSGTEPPLSAASYSSYDSGFSSGGASSSSGQAAQSRPMEYPYASYASYNLMRAAGTPSYWNPAPGRSPAAFMHPPMLPPDDGGMDYIHTGPVAQVPAQHQQHQQQAQGQQQHQHGQQHHEEDMNTLFNSFLHPPMMLPESPQHHFLSLHPHQQQQQHQQQQMHPPMLPPDFPTASDFFAENGLVQGCY
jgi:GATA-binding protein